MKWVHRTTTRVSMLLFLMVVMSGAFTQNAKAQANLTDQQLVTVIQTMNQAYCFTTPDLYPGSLITGPEISFTNPNSSNQEWVRRDCFKIFQSPNDPNRMTAGYEQIRANGCYLITGLGALNPCNEPGGQLGSTGVFAIAAIREATNQDSAGSGDEGQDTFTDPTLGDSEDTGPSAEELQEQFDQEAADLRNQLSRTENNCGGDNPDTNVAEGSTQFNFECAPATDCSGLSGDARIVCEQRNNPIINLVFSLIRFLTFGIGILIIFSIILSGFQYMTAQGNSQTTGKALKRIFNAVIALLLYIFAFAIMNYLVPGGLIQ